ncbi:MAG: T9SS type A sorting domain-containing protein, partial [Fibrobacteres bacterium]|nr:T9SS type A sorting domain-containing protein [Fibrobacterota bacterium]
IATAEQSVSVPALSFESSKALMLSKTLNATASPNPFSKTVQIAVTVNKSKNKPNVSIYDVNGRLVKVLSVKNILGNMSLYGWDGTDNLGGSLRNGFYFYRVRLNGEEVSGRLTLLK